MCDVVILKKVQMTVDILKSIPKNVIEEDNLFLQMVLDVGYADDQYLIDQDYIYCELSKNGKIYKMIHGYPGDTAMGTVYKDNKFISSLCDGMNLEDNLNEFELWYTQKYNDVYLTLSDICDNICHNEDYWRDCFIDKFDNI